jgi:hypothetical protein
MAQQIKSVGAVSLRLLGNAHVDRRGIRSPRPARSTSKWALLGAGVHIPPEGSAASGFGILVAETIAKVRCAYFVQGKSIKAICLGLGVSRKVVRKVLRSEATDFAYERSVQPEPKIRPWREQLERLLAANAARPHRERLTLTRVFE